MWYPVFVAATIVFAALAIIIALRQPLGYLTGKALTYLRRANQEGTEAFHEGRTEDDMEELK